MFAKNKLSIGERKRDPKNDPTAFFTGHIANILDVAKLLFSLPLYEIQFLIDSW